MSRTKGNAVELAPMLSGDGDQASGP